MRAGFSEGFVLAALAAATAQAHGATIKVGEPAPNFRLTTFAGEQVELASLRGQVIVLNYWATWCGPCKRELPLLDAYYRKAAPWGLKIYAVATEDSVPPYQLKPVQAVLSFPMVKRMRGAYDIKDAVPTNYVIDRQGVVRYAAAGAFELDDLNRILIPLLQEKPAEAPAASPPVAR